MNALTVAVLGGAGYVGSALVPKLLAAGHRVRVFDLFLYGRDVLSACADDPLLEQVQGDIRNTAAMEDVLRGVDAVIHLACISNDPSFDLDPALGKSINYDSFLPLVERARDQGVDRFIFASSSSVYGVKQEAEVTEEATLEPLTDYSRFKALCEDLLLQVTSPSFNATIVRPATVCGYSARQRLDLVVNILTAHAVHNGHIRVFGGTQLRPNVHIDDLTDLYVQLLREPTQRIRGQVYNVGCENHSVAELGEIVRQGVDRLDVEIGTEPSDDLRSYHISSRRVEAELGFVPKLSVTDAVVDLQRAFSAGLVPKAMTDDIYYNVRHMKSMRLT